MTKTQSIDRMLEQELTFQACSPPGDDIRIAAFCEAFLKLMNQNEAAPIMDALRKSRPGITPSYSVNLLLRVMQKQLLLTDPVYPLDYVSESAWTGSLFRLLEDESRTKVLIDDLTQRQTQSNVVERYKTFKIVMSLLDGKISNYPRILDVGCSRNHGLKKLHLNLPFQPVECGLRDNARLPHLLLDRLFNETLKRQLQLGKSLGTDIIRTTDGENATWAKSCSFYPSELLDKAAVAEYDYLDSADLPNVDFSSGDFTEYGLGADESEQKFDVIIASTFMYQLAPEQRVYARNLFKTYLGPKGVIIYQDFVRTTPHNDALQFEVNWFESIFPYRTIVEFNDGSDKLYEVLRWNNGRCLQWVPGRDISLVVQ